MTPQQAQELIAQQPPYGRADLGWSWSAPQVVQVLEYHNERWPSHPVKVGDCSTCGYAKAQAYAKAMHYLRELAQTVPA